MNLGKFLDENVKLIDNEIQGFLAKNQGQESEFLRFIYGLIKSSTLDGGKRLRPIAMMMSYEACGGKDKKKILLPAAAIELHQAYSLILDDIMDEDEARRDKHSAYKQIKDYYLRNFSEKNYHGSLFDRRSSRFTVSQALMAGNMAGILSKKAIHACSFSDGLKARALEAIDKGDEMIYNGQMMDVLMEYKDATEAEYLAMIRLKTASFFAMSLEVGCIFAQADENRTHLFKEFGMESATAYQIQDDLLDLTGAKGHEIGSDIKKGKKTLLYIKTKEKADTAQAKILQEAFGNPNAPDSLIKKTISIMHDTGAIDHCKRLARQRQGLADERLKSLRLDSYYSGLFKELSDFMVSRKT